MTAVSRRGVLMGGTRAAAGAALAAVGLAGCAEPVPMPVAAVVPPPPEPRSELRERIEADGPVVGGVRLNAGLLKRFYARRDYAPVWATRRGQVDSLVAAVLRAGEHGLDRELFHAGLLRQEAGLSALDRDLLLSDAFLAYGDALARGAIPVERRREDQVLTPEPIDVAAVLSDAADERDPARAIEALAPATPTYEALRAALQKVRGARPSAAASNRLRTIEVNLERQRWLPRALPATRAWVNVADERLVLYRSGEPVFTTRVVVGEDVEKNQSPEFRATINASFYNPPWVIPAEIAKAEILSKLGDDPEYLTKNNMVVLANGEVEQQPGPDAGLGYIMFDMPNKFDVYLHDTPDRTVFSRENRRISHGCIRVQEPRDLAALLMDQTVETIHQGIAAGSTVRNELPKPVAVFVVYQTAFADAGGALQFRPDFYQRDGAVWRALHGERGGVAGGGGERVAGLGGL